MAIEVLFVDLDGTLVATDMLYESLLLAIKRDPLVLLTLPVWAASGRAQPNHTRPSAATIPQGYSRVP
jgi:hypothetical protein